MRNPMAFIKPVWQVCQALPKLRWRCFSPGRTCGPRPGWRLTTWPRRSKDASTAERKLWHCCNTSHKHCLFSTALPGSYCTPWIFGWVVEIFSLKNFLRAGFEARSLSFSVFSSKVRLIHRCPGKVDLMQWYEFVGSIGEVEQCPLQQLESKGPVWTSWWKRLKY